MIRLRVKELAQQKGISQGRLSHLAIVDSKTLRRIYHDPYAYISTETLVKIAKALQVSVIDLIEEVPDEEP